MAEYSAVHTAFGSAVKLRVPPPFSHQGTTSNLLTDRSSLHEVIFPHFLQLLFLSPYSWISVALQSLWSLLVQVSSPAMGHQTINLWNGLCPKMYRYSQLHLSRSHRIGHHYEHLWPVCDRMHFNWTRFGHSRNHRTQWNCYSITTPFPFTNTIYEYHHYDG